MLENNTSKINFRCPVFTKLIHDLDDGVYQCQYEIWFYGLAATLVCFGGLMPIVFLICCWAKWKNSKIDRRKLHRQDSDASTHTDLSRPHDHGVYEVMRDDNDEKGLIFRTSKGPYHQRYGTFSVPDFRTMNEKGIPHIYPDISQIESSGSLPVSPSSGLKPNIKSERGHIGSSKALPSPRKRKRTRIDGVTTEKIDSYFRSIEESNNTKPVENCERVQNEEDKSREKVTKEEAKGTDGFDSSSESGRLSMIAGCTVPKDVITPKKSIAEASSSVDTQVTPNASSFPCFQPTPPMKHLVDRVDFDQYLCDCVSKLPEDQKNGTFLIRDSQSHEGCKVLTIYFKDQDPSKILYHYKVCFSEDIGKVSIPGTEDIFMDLDEMVEFYRLLRAEKMSTIKKWLYLSTFKPQQQRSKDVSKSNCHDFDAMRIRNAIDLIYNDIAGNGHACAKTGRALSSCIVKPGGPMIREVSLETSHM